MDLVAERLLGSSLGMKEWQKEHSIPSAQLQLTGGKMNHLLQEFTARTNEKISVWPGWKPFRFGFTQFELESKCLLKQQSEIERVEPGHSQQGASVNIGVFNWVQAETVKYADASPVVLRHAYLVLKETLSEDFADANAASEDDGVQYLMEMADRICQEERNDRERAALLFEIAATNHGEGRALERCIDISIDDATQSSRASRAVVILENFVAQLLPKSRWQRFQLSTADLEKMENYVLPNCRKMMHHFGDQLEISERLSVLFEIAWWSNPERFTQRALSGLQMLYCLSKSPGVLFHNEESLWHTGASDACNAKIRNVQCLTAAQGESRMDNDGARGALERDCFQLRKQMLQTSLHEQKDPYLRSRIANSLGWLLKTGAEGVEADPREAVALYRRAIEEGNHVAASNNLASLLETGAEVVEADPREAVALYRRAIEEGNNLSAMYNLASLLQTGAEGVEADPREAVALYRRAIEEGNYVNAMNNLAFLLQTGAEGVEADPREAVALYRRAIGEGNQVSAMYNLAFLLHTGLHGVDVNAREAVALYERAISEGNDVDAMYGLARLLETGGDGVDADEERAATLYEQAGEVGDAGERLAALRRRLR